ncbi:xenotropic and polytropic retrovirus receptor 1 [Nematocida sp. AWRm79]|nr:xenotropic and polytropic retrovirus receptor 1 [Nematocida sp. AWRm79]
MKYSLSVPWILMKFSKTLKEKQVQEWRAKYLNYEDLKEKIDMTEDAFISEINKEVEKVEAFYKILERGILRGLADLLELFPEEDFPYAYEMVYENWKLAMAKSVSVRHKRSRQERLPKKSIHKVRENKVLEFYVALNKIVQYKRMNITGFRKILKKYDKKNGTSIQGQMMEEIRTRSTFVQQTIEEIIEFTRYLHKEITPNRHRDKAKRLVADLTEEDAQGDGKSFAAGAMMSSGLFMMGLSLQNNTNIMYYGALYTFDILFLSLGVLFYVCRKNLVNYSLILELNLKPKFKISSYFLMCTIVFLMHSVAGYLDIPSWMIYILTVCIMCMPIDHFYKEIRMYLLQTVSEVLACSVLGKVHFKHFFIADYFISIRSALLLSITMGLHEAPGPKVTCCILYIPIMIRVFQCIRRHFEKTNRQPFPHLYNTLKYMISFASDTLLILSDTINIWVCVSALLISHGFGMFWDVYVDWMLWSRPKVYHREVYIFACLFNLIVRILAVSSPLVSLVMQDYQFEAKLKIKLVMCFLEMSRRIIWGIVRIEVEHLNNCNRLKAISGPLNDLFYLEDDGHIEI